MNTDLAQVNTIPPLAGMAVDAIAQVVRLLLNILLLAGIAKVVSRNKAQLRPKPVFWTTVAALSLAFLLNTAPDGVLRMYPFFVVAFGTTLIVRQVFRVDIEKALIASVLFVFLSLALKDVSNRGLDHLMPGRATIGGYLSEQIDARTRAQTGDATLPPSRRVLPALLSMAANTTGDEGGFFGHLLAPFRTLGKAEQQVADVDKAAREQASIVNMPSGARAAEPEAPTASPAVDPLPQSPADTSGVAGTAPGASSVTSPAPGSAAATASAAPAGTTNDAVGAETASATNALIEDPEQILSGFPEEERERWRAAEARIHVSATGTSHDGAYALVDDRFVSVGATCTILYQDRYFDFRLVTIDASGDCRWVPVPPQEGADEEVIEFIRF